MKRNKTNKTSGRAALDKGFQHINHMGHITQSNERYFVVKTLLMTLVMEAIKYKNTRDLLNTKQVAKGCSSFPRITA